MTASPRSSILKLLLDHCPAAVAHAERGTPMDRRIFAVGTAAHDFLEGAHNGVPLDQIHHRLLTIGREGVDPEPPLPPDAVQAGRDLAERWIAVKGIQAKHAERQFRFGLDWQPDPPAGDPLVCSARVDYVDLIEDEPDEDGYGGGVIAVVGDYKTAWPDDDSVLDTLQRRIQAVCAWLTYPAATTIRVEIANLRRLQIYQRDILLDEDGVALVEGWKAQIETLARVLHSGDRRPRPGPGCVSCPYVLACEAASDELRGLTGDRSPEELLALHGAAGGLSAAAETMLRDLSAEGEVLIGDFVVGQAEASRQEVIPGAGARLLAEWLRASGIDGPLLDEVCARWVAFFPAGVKGFSDVAKRQIPKVEREAWLRERVVQRPAPCWGIRRREGP